MQDLIITREQTPHEREFCKDPAFYVWGNHQLVAQVAYKDRKISVYCDGEMRLRVWASKEARIDNINPEVIRYCDRLVEADINTDEKLQKALQEERIEFDNNAWFDLYADDDKKQYSKHQNSLVTRTGRNSASKHIYKYALNYVSTVKPRKKHNANRYTSY